MSKSGLWTRDSSETTGMWLCPILVVCEVYLIMNLNIANTLFNFFVKNMKCLVHILAHFTVNWIFCCCCCCYWDNTKCTVQSDWLHPFTFDSGIGKLFSWYHVLLWNDKKCLLSFTSSKMFTDFSFSMSPDWTQFIPDVHHLQALLQ